MDQTTRRQIIDLLEKQSMTLRELSQAAACKERDVYAHLPHIEKSLKARNKKLVMGPFSCKKCGYVFKDRRRLTRPGRCPACKNSHIESPVYRILVAP